MKVIRIINCRVETACDLFQTENCDFLLLRLTSVYFVDVYLHIRGMDDNNKSTLNETSNTSNTIEVMEIIQLSIAPIGIVRNLTVIVVFLNNKRLRRKIPNKFIVNQVSII